MKKTIALIGTFDSKGKEFDYVKNILESVGVNTLMIHTGVFEPTIAVDINNDEVFKATNAD